MALYDGFPSIELEGDQERALALIPEGKALLYRVQEIKRRANVPVYAQTKRIDEDSFVYALSTETINLIRISVAPDGPKQEDPDFEVPVVEAEIPPAVAPINMLSGLILRGHINDAETPNRLLTYYPTPATRRRHGLSMGGQPSRRLAVEPHSSFSDLRNNSESQRPIYSQYTRLRPTMYSGKMQAVVQTLMGLGRLPDPVLNDMLDRGVPRTYVEEIRTQGVQIRYDYKYERTHGISVADDGRLWLIEISMTRGVLAMPLPIIPGSDTEGFRRQFEDPEDRDILAVLEVLGCIPTGQSFPARFEDLAPLLASGEVQRLLEPSELSEFFRAQAYSSVIGWAFSGDGREAHNTGFYYDDVGYQRGVWWELRIRIGPSLPNWRPNAGMGPRANATASARERGNGYLYSEKFLPPTNPRCYLPFKTNVPGMGLVSHAAQPMGVLPAPRCDTVVFVAFINDELHTVSFYRGSREDLFDEREDDAPPDGCYYSGSWTTVRRSGSRTFPPMMYSNREDQRQVAQDRVVTDTYESRDRGPLPGRWSTDILYPQYAHVSRARLFEYESTRSVRSDEQYICSVSLPEFVREGYYMAYGESATTEVTSRTVGYNALMDPNRALAWRCLGAGMYRHPGFPTADPATCGGNCSSLAGPGWPRVHGENRAIFLYRVGGECADYADGGQWLSLCENVDVLLDQPYPSLPQPQTTSVPPITTSSAWIRLFMTGTEGPLTTVVTFDVAWRWWFPSPHPTTGEFHQIAAYHNALGTQGVCYFTDYVGYGARRTEGYFVHAITPNDPIPTFVGVHQP